MPKSPVVRTSPVPNTSCQKRLTVTRAVSGWSARSSHLAKPSRFFGRSVGHRRQRLRACRPSPCRGACRTRRGTGCTPSGSLGFSAMTWAIVPRDRIAVSSCCSFGELRRQLPVRLVQRHQPPVEQLLGLLRRSACRPAWRADRPPAAALASCCGLGPGQARGRRCAGPGARRPLQPLAGVALADLERHLRLDRGLQRVGLDVHRLRLAVDVDLDPGRLAGAVVGRRRRDATCPAASGVLATTFRASCPASC